MSMSKLVVWIEVWQGKADFDVNSRQSLQDVEVMDSTQMKFWLTSTPNP